MADLEHWDKDEAWTIQATFAVSGTPTNPTTVAATAYKPDGTTEPYTFPSANISNPSAGVFRVTDTGDIVGTWYIEVVGTGSAAGRARHAIIIDPRWPADLLNTDALTTIEQVELLLDRVGTQGTSGQEENDKKLIADLVNAFSDAVHAYTQRQFKPTQTTATKLFVYDGNGSLSLAPYEATTVTAVVLYSDRPVGEQWTLIAADDYRLEPRQKTAESTYLSVTLPKVRSGGLTVDGDVVRQDLRGVQVSVTGTWGAGVVPSDVEYVVKAEAANAYMRATQRAPRGIGAEDFLGPDVGPLALSRRAQAILDFHSNREVVS